MLGVRGGFVAGGVLRVRAEDGLLPAVIPDFRGGNLAIAAEIAQEQP